jgi:hypothetical protein
MERKSIFEANEVEILMTSKAIIDNISDGLRRVHGICSSMSSIKAANKLYLNYYEDFKKKAFKPYENSILKPYLLYQVNRWFKHITHA